MCSSPQEVWEIDLPRRNLLCFAATRRTAVLLVLPMSIVTIDDPSKDHGVTIGTAGTEPRTLYFFPSLSLSLLLSENIGIERAAK